MYRTIVAMVICCTLLSSSAFAVTMDEYNAEKQANYSKYMPGIKSLIPKDWVAGDLIEANLKNQYGVPVTSLLLLIFNQKSQIGKFLVIVKSGDSFVKKWEATENVQAEDGLFGDTEDFRYPADINKDVRDEIIITFSSGRIPSQGLVSLWIYQWDGSNGTLISPMSEDDPELSRFIGSQKQTPALIDVDNDGIYEVFAEGQKIYKWLNGKYVYWKDQHLAD